MESNASRDVLNFPLRCASCGAVQGQLYAVRSNTDRPEMTAEVRCGVCKHEWEIDLPVLGRPYGEA